MLNGVSRAADPTSSGPMSMGAGGEAGGVLDLAARRLQWLSTRQQVLAANVANSDTPGFKPKDVSPFAERLAQVTMHVNHTDPAHFVLDAGAEAAGASVIDHEQAPDGNAISLQQQLTEIAGNDSDQRMATNLYAKVMQMYSTALGR